MHNFCMHMEEEKNRGKLAPLYKSWLKEAATKLKEIKIETDVVQQQIKFKLTDNFEFYKIYCV